LSGIGWVIFGWSAERARGGVERAGGGNGGARVVQAEKPGDEC